MYNLKKMSVRRLIAATVFLFLIVGFLQAENPVQAQTFTLRIKLLDETGAAIESSSPPTIELTNCTTPAISATQSLGGGVYDLAISTGVEDKNCDLRITSPQFLYSTPISTGDIGVTFQDKSGSPTTLYYRTRVLVKNASGDPVNDAIVHHAGFSPQKISGGIYYFTTNSAGPLLIERTGFITESGDINTQLRSVSGGTENAATVITLFGNALCNNGVSVSAGTSANCSALEPSYIINVKNQNGEVLSDATVRVYTDMARTILANDGLVDGNFDAQKTTDGNGNASFALSGGLYYIRIERLGYNDENLTANIQGGIKKSDSIVLKLAGDNVISPGKSQVNVSPSSVPADGASQSIITVRVYDNSQNQLGRRTVTPVSNRTEDVITPASALTNNSGEITFIVTSTKTGDAVFSILVEGITLSTFPKVSFTVSEALLNSTAPSANESSVTASVSPVASNGEALITATIKNSAGAILEGKNVKLSSSRPDEDTITPAAVLTGTDGKATFKIKSSKTGTSVISIMADNVTLREMAIITFSPASYVSAGYLIKTSNNQAVYYYGKDGRRHAFPNERIYKTWYQDFSGIRLVTPDELAAIPLGKNVTYRPGVKMIKLQTVPKVYAVGQGGALRWVQTEDVAKSLYGTDWNKKIDDISDAFFTDYFEDTVINSSSDFTPSLETSNAPDIDSTL